MKKGSENIAKRLIPEGTRLDIGGIAKLGFPCKICGSETKVVDSRAHSMGAYRRRECIRCHAKYSTIEQEVSRLLSMRKEILSILDTAKNQLDSVLVGKIIR